MEKKNNEITRQQEVAEPEKITRKDAIKKTGYAALSAATMMILLSNNAQAGGNKSGGYNFGGKKSGGEKKGGGYKIGDGGHRDKHKRGDCCGGPKSSPCN